MLTVNYQKIVGRKLQAAGEAAGLTFTTGAAMSRAAEKQYVIWVLPLTVSAFSNLHQVGGQLDKFLSPGIRWGQLAVDVLPPGSVQEADLFTKSETMADFGLFLDTELATRHAQFVSVHTGKPGAFRLMYIPDTAPSLFPDRMILTVRVDEIKLLEAAR